MRYIQAFLVFSLPSKILIPILRLFGHQIGKNVRIGFSFIMSKKLIISDNVKIGHFNLILNNEVKFYKESYIGYLNILKGPFKLELAEKAAIGNKNYLTRGELGITYGESVLSLGKLTKITTSHHLDLTRSIIFGDFSILAGIRSQMWTHGYYHANKGPDRIRIDGEIIIGDNVYIGSGCIFNPGIEVSNAVHIGGGTVISKSLEKSGMYVGQALRYIDNDIEKIKPKLQKIEDSNLVEQVYTKE